MMKNKKILIIIPVVLVAFIAVYAGIMLSGRGITATDLRYVRRKTRIRFYRSFHRL